MESNDNLEQLLKQMYAKETLHDEDIDMKDIVDEEWAKFEAEHFGSEQGKVKSKKVSFLKIAAMFIGVLMLSGIAYAAIHVISSHKQQDQALQEVVEPFHAPKTFHQCCRSMTSASICALCRQVRNGIPFDGAQVPLSYAFIQSLTPCLAVSTEVPSKYIA